jgi:hypothetical protein
VSCERSVLSGRDHCVGLIFCYISPTECGVSNECECGVMTLNRIKALQKKSFAMILLHIKVLVGAKDCRLGRYLKYQPGILEPCTEFRCSMYFLES